VARIHGSDEAISAAGLRFDVSWILGGVAQCPPEFIHGGIQAVLEIYESLPGPDFLAQLLAANQFAWPCQQDQ
jgi:hypothetical protein